MLYGEVYADKIDPPCGEGTDTPCITGRWVTPAVMSIYLLIANILLINLLIAVFNNIFNEVNAVSHQVWMFQRFTVVMEYEQKPILPPPFIIICHVFLLFKYLKRKLNHKEESYDNGLKLFLERDEMDRLYDFEEDCVDGYFAERDYKLQQSSEERIRLTHDRVESVTQVNNKTYIKKSHNVFKTFDPVSSSFMNSNFCDVYNAVIIIPVIIFSKLLPTTLRFKRTVAMNRVCPAR